jgi:hypothetical protein
VPEWWPALLLFVFATHGPFFAWRWTRTREPRHAATTLTFALLTGAYGLRVFAPRAAWGDVPLWQAARVVAWGAAAVSLSLIARHGWQALRRRRASARSASSRPASP